MSKLWAITSYFNPAGFANRLKNYRVFRDRLQVPLATIELSFDGAFALKRDDADIVLQIPGSSIMWQKERLLNLILQELPAECEYVAWIDADVVFQSNDWATHTQEALKDHGWVHLFEQRLDLKPDESLDEVLTKNLPIDSGSTTYSMIYQRSIGKVSDEELTSPIPVLMKGMTSGLAWASTREILNRHGFYDGCIFGGGDRVMLYAALGRFDFAEKINRMEGAFKQHYHQWATPFHQTIQGRVCNIPGVAIHQWHGSLKDRGYYERKAVLPSHEYDPFTDIHVNQEGIFDWASDKPDMHAEIAGYFASRKEDG
jgi:hypothetical protein